jgi:tRNA (guanine26-N2/guanine27-N2)-dimethyltransferase
MLLNENGIHFYVYEDVNVKVPSKSMIVFYNKKMEINRDIMILAVQAYNELYNKSPLTILEGMAASGVGAIRLLRELPNIHYIYVNDLNPIAVELIKENMNLNKVSTNRVSISHKDVNYMMLDLLQTQKDHQQDKLNPLDVILIDPFGTPNLYVDAACKLIHKRNGMLSFTATDTAVLFGVRSNACIRKYMAKPLHVEYAKEIGARILINFISKIANVNNVGIKPLLTFYSNHFLRVFLLTFKEKEEISSNFLNNGYIIHCKKCGFRDVQSDDPTRTLNTCPECFSSASLDYAGPLWIGELYDTKFVKKLLEANLNRDYRNKKRINKTLLMILEEIGMPPTYYNIHTLGKQLKLKALPKLPVLIDLIKKEGHSISRTHFDFLSIKTTLNKDELKTRLEQLTYMRLKK